MVLENIQTIQDLVLAINTSSYGVFGLVVLYMIILPFLFIVSLRTMSPLKSAFFSVVVGFILAGLLAYFGIISTTHVLILFSGSVVLGILAFIYG